MIQISTFISFEWGVFALSSSKQFVTFLDSIQLYKYYLFCGNNNYPNIQLFWILPNSSLLWIRHIYLHTDELKKGIVAPPYQEAGSNRWLRPDLSIDPRFFALTFNRSLRICIRSVSLKYVCNSIYDIIK